MPVTVYAECVRYFWQSSVPSVKGILHTDELKQEMMLLIRKKTKIRSPSMKTSNLWHS